MKMRVGIGLLAVVLGTGMGSAHGAMHIEAPTVMDNTMLSVTVSDLHGLIDGLGSAAAKVSPMMNGTTLKSLMGMQLGDPMMSGIPVGKGLAVVALDPATVFGVIELSAPQLPAYTNKLATMGMQCRYKDGMLVVAKQAAALAKGVATANAVRASLLTRRSPTIRIDMQPADYIAANGAQIDGMLASMTETMNKGLQAQAQMQGQAATTPPENTVKVLEGEVRVLLSLLQQIDTMEFILTPANGALQIDQIIQPNAGSRLNALVNAPKKNPWNPKVQTGSTGSAAFMVDLLVENTEALSTFIKGETEQFANAMAMDTDTVQRMSSYLQKVMTIYTGSVSESILGGTTPGFNVDYVMEVNDEKAALDLLRNMQADLKAMGFLDFYESIGTPMSYTFKENVRQYKGVKIHQFKTTISIDQMPAMQRQQLEAMNLSDTTCDVAILNGVMAYVMGDTTIESVIDRIQGPATASPLAARSIFPDGGFYYGDMDLGRYMAFISAMMPQMPGTPVPFDAMSTALQGAPPITSAGHTAGGLVQWSIHIPADLLARLGQAVMAFQMQQMQKQMSTPAP